MSEYLYKGLSGTNIDMVGSVSGATLYNGPAYGALPIGTVSGPAQILGESTTMFQIKVPGYPTGWVDRGQLTNLRAPPAYVPPAPPPTPIQTLYTTPAGPPVSLAPPPGSPPASYFRPSSAGASDTTSLLVAALGVAAYLFMRKG